MLTKPNFKLPRGVNYLLLLLIAAMAFPAGAENVSFPDMDRAVQDGGTTVPVENIALVVPGMRKNQIYPLLGVPDFPTGFDARVWNYILNIKKQDGTGTILCQYQLRFLSGGVLGKIHWRTTECLDLYRSQIGE